MSEATAAAVEEPTEPMAQLADWLAWHANRAQRGLAAYTAEDFLNNAGAIKMILRVVDRDRQERHEAELREREASEKARAAATRDAMKSWTATTKALGSIEDADTRATAVATMLDDLVNLIRQSPAGTRPFLSAPTLRTLLPALGRVIAETERASPEGSSLRGMVVAELLAPRQAR